MKSYSLPAFQDSYLWLLHDGLVVDPGDALPAMPCLRSEGLQLEAILVTHHHPDHIDGAQPDNAELNDYAARRERLRPRQEARGGAAANDAGWVLVTPRQWKNKFK